MYILVEYNDELDQRHISLYYKQPLGTTFLNKNKEICTIAKITEFKTHRDAVIELLNRRRQIKYGKAQRKK